MNFVKEKKNVRISLHVQKCWAFEMRYTVMRRVSKFVPFFHQLAIWRLAVTALSSLIYVPIIVRPIVAFVAVGSQSILVLFALSLTVAVSLSVSPISVRSVLPSSASPTASASASAPIAASIASAATTVLHGVLLNRSLMEWSRWLKDGNWIVRELKLNSLK